MPVDSHPREQVLSLGILKQSIVALDKISLSGLVGALDGDVLAEPAGERPSLRLIKTGLFLTTPTNYSAGMMRISSLSGSVRL